MTKDVLISISGVHTMDGEKNDVAVITPGNYYYKNGKHYVVYEEIVEGHKDTVKNTIKISPAGVDIIKNGVAAAHMVFEKNKKNVTLYQTPAGQMAVGLSTSEITIDEDADQLKVMVDYKLDVNYEPLSECSMVVDIQSKATADFHLS